METKNNMELYNKVREVPKSAQKQFDNGRFKGTDIKPQWRIEKLTEIFGPVGFGWYFGKPEYEIQVDGQTKTVYCTVPLYIKLNGEWSQPIWGTGGNTITAVKRDGSLTITDEGYKCAYTDAQSNACKLLGVGADVWYEASDTKYLAQQEVAQAKLNDALKEVDNCKTANEVVAVWNKHKDLQKNIAFKEKVAKTGKAFKEKEGKDDAA